MPKSESGKMPSEREQAIADLRELVKPGDTVYTVLRRVSRSGESRVIVPLVFRVRGEAGKDPRSPEPYYLGYKVSRALGLPEDGDHGVKIHGSGMDMGFELVYRIASVLFPGGGDLPDGTHEDNGGYLLRQRWL